MRIHQAPTLKLNNQTQNRSNNQDAANSNVANSQPSFKGAAAFTQFLSFLETNAAWGASVVDVTCMGIPRSTVDFTRGPEAGLETMRREFSSTADDAAIGAFGVGAAWLLSRGLSKQYGINAHKILASDETLDMLGETWNEQKGSKNQLNKYLQEIATSSKGFNPDKAGADKNGFIGFSKNAKDFAERFEKEIKSGSKKMSNETRDYLSNLFVGETGAERNIKIERNGKKIMTSLDNYLNDIYNVSKTFIKEDVAKTFANGGIKENVFLNSLKKLNRNTAIGGLAIATGIGCSLQPLNMYLTRKKTGKSGFVGVEGREPDKSKGFKFLKLGVAAAACYGVMRTIAKKPVDVLRAVQFKGLTPTVPQFKFVYGLTIVSRLLSARDKNELRESSIKDSLGFVNWLILGGFVSKLTAAGFEKMAKFKNAGQKFVRYNEAENGKGGFNWLTKSSVITRKEVLLEEFQKAGLSVIENGKALSVKEMLKKAPQSAKTRIKYLNMIQVAGYLWSGLALGFGIPKLNIAITNSIEKKRKAKEAQMAAK